ncbi:AAA family ATPase [uncultured Acetatifactor sp.]|uniref:AAA family ATPase n=1 Tax=uncultured Acetatifactor sp. TaxID=1671927 RepID=UPI002F4046A1
MGIYVNPGNASFEMSRFSDIYVDKSMLITQTNRVYRTERRFLCVSRPRRFGKSMAANMLTAYYSKGCDSGRLFSGLAMEKEDSFPVHLNRHNVIRWDVQRFLDGKRSIDTFIDEIERMVIRDLQREFPECGSFPEGSRLRAVLDEIYGERGEGFVFIIDEWDCLFRMAKERKKVQKEYLDFLRGLFKGAEYVELAYITGILPIKKYGEHSALNIFEEYSLTDPKSLGKYFGFTAEEVKEQCEIHGVDFREMERWYDGYLIEGCHVYNPKSVADALTWKEFRSYWTGTETYEALKVYIDRNFDGLKEAVVGMLGGIQCRIRPEKFQNDMTTFGSKDDVLTLLVHLGYLSYDRKNSEVSIPNLEITQEFLNVVDSPDWGGLTEALNRSDELLKNFG